MTVLDLLEALAGMPKDATVTLECDSCFHDEVFGVRYDRGVVVIDIDSVGPEAAELTED